MRSRTTYTKMISNDYGGTTDGDKGAAHWGLVHKLNPCERTICLPMSQYNLAQSLCKINQT